MLDNAAGSVSLNTTIGTQQVTSLGFQPKMILFTTTPDTADIVSSVANMHASFGAVDQSLSQCVVAMNARNGVTVSDTQAMTRAALTAIVADPPGTPTVDYEFSVSQLLSSGFEINISNPPPINYKFGYWALGGDDITHTKVGIFLSKGSAGTQAITGIGFEPSLVILFTSMTQGSLPADLSDGNLSVGFASGVLAADQFAIGNFVQNGVAFAPSSRFANSGFVVFTGVSSSFPNMRATLQSFDSDGFTLNWIQHASVAQKHIGYIAIKGTTQFKSSVGSVKLPNSVGSISVSGLSFEPATGLFVSTGQDTLGLSAVADGIHSIGFIDNLYNGYTVGGSVRNAASPTKAWHFSHSGRIYREIDPDTGAILEEGNLTSWTSDGFTVNLSTASAAGAYLGYLVLTGEQYVPPFPDPLLEENIGNMI